VASVFNNKETLVTMISMARPTQED